MKMHKISIDVDETLFNFHQELLPWGERKLLYNKLLIDLQVIHKADPTLIRAYIEGKINLLQFADRIRTRNENKS
ncbi:MAG: hypothetical protein GY804_00990 [Alphaproteobacteria bacterium]|nr:hypothetical protein [Alphaproteobacteria bacterium]